MYTPTMPPYELLGHPMRAPRMWGVERDPRASLGRQGKHWDSLVGVFGAVSVAAVESLRGSLVAPWAPWESPREFLAARARPWASPACRRSRGTPWCL